MRTSVSILPVAIAAMALAGCTATGDPAPPASSAGSSPTPTPSAELCSPSSANDIAWDDAVEADPVEVGYRVFTVDDTGRVVSTADATIGYETTVERNVAGGATGWSDAENIDTLLESANATGVGPVQLGDPEIDFGEREVAAEVDVDEPGTFVLGYRLDQVTVDFDLTCSEGLTGDGVLTTTAGGVGTTLVQCGTDPQGEGDLDYAGSLLGYCPA